MSFFSRARFFALLTLATVLTPSAGRLTADEPARTKTTETTPIDVMELLMFPLERSFPSWIYQNNAKPYRIPVAIPVITPGSPSPGDSKSVFDFYMSVGHVPRTIDKNLPGNLDRWEHSRRFDSLLQRKDWSFPNQLFESLPAEDGLKQWHR